MFALLVCVGDLRVAGKNTSEVNGYDDNAYVMDVQCICVLDCVIAYVSHVCATC